MEKSKIKKARKIIGGILLTVALIGFYISTSNLEIDNITFLEAIKSYFLSLICGVIGYFVYYPYDK